MEEYKNSLNRYYATLRKTDGCGDRAQGYIDKAHQELSYAWLGLTPQEKIDNPLPEKETCKNDGTGGIATGLSVAGQDGCSIQ